MTGYVTKELPPMWTLWSYISLYQTYGMEWQSPEMKEQILVVKAKKLLHKIKKERT